MSREKLRLVLIAEDENGAKHFCGEVEDFDQYDLRKAVARSSIMNEVADLCEQEREANKWSDDLEEVIP